MITLERIEDINVLMAWREEVILNVFGKKPSESLLEANRNYYERNVRNGKHIAYIARFDGKEAGSGSLCLGEELPSPDNEDGRCAYLMNIYVREEFREHGIGHHIVEKLLDEAKKLKCGKIYLETTEMGRSLYESLGFSDLPDMMKYQSKHDC